jgi:hypothetical protein
MRQLREHPLRTLALLLGVAVVLFMLSGIPRYREAKHWGVDLIVSDIFWFGFLICALSFLAGAGYVLARRLRTRGSAA